jgi:hypothetical protein
MVTIQRSFAPADRYRYDFGTCTAAKGWAQVDTSQDASYFGTWINPATRELLNYCEGDIALTKHDTDAELCATIADIKAWNETQGHRFMGIDPMCNDALEAALVAAGLAPFFHADNVQEVA